MKKNRKPKKYTVSAWCYDCHRKAEVHRWDFYKAATLRCAYCGGLMSRQYIPPDKQQAGATIATPPVKPACVSPEVPASPCPTGNQELGASITLSPRPRRLCVICHIPTYERYSLLLGELLNTPPGQGNAERLNTTIDMAICSRHFSTELQALRKRITEQPEFADKLDTAIHGFKDKTP